MNKRQRWYLNTMDRRFELRKLIDAVKIAGMMARMNTQATDNKLRALLAADANLRSELRTYEKRMAPIWRKDRERVDRKRRALRCRLVRVRARP